MEKTNLKERVMIVSLHISSWGAIKYDQKITREVEEKHNTTGVGRFNKRLMKHPKLDEIKTVEGKIRSFHREMTLPWGDDNTRIITTEKSFEYMTKIGAYKYQHGQLVDEFCGIYSEAIEKEKGRLNGMFRQEDYPHTELIKEKFQVKVAFLPLADENDFRVKLSEEMETFMKQQAKDELLRRVQTANDNLLKRARENVGKMIEKLTEQGTFRDSLVGNVQEIAQVLTEYNFSDDEHIREVVTMLKTLCVNPDMLRNNEAFKSETLKKAKDVLNAI